VLRHIPGVRDIAPAGDNGAKWYIDTEHEKDIRADVAKALVEKGLRLVELKALI
jgi:hypothetical protein